MAVVALFAPFAMQVSINPWDSYIALIAMTWQWHPYYWNPYLFDPFILIMTIPMAGLRLVFVGMIHRLYKVKTTRKRVGIIAIAAELQFVAIGYIPYIMMLLLNPFFTPYFPMIFPIPLLLPIGVVLLRFSPPPGEPSVWRDDDREEYWWEESEDETDDSDEENRIKMSDRLWFRLDSSEDNARK
jgi:hypothetical protein